MQKYLERITPQVSSVWRADELYLKVKGNMKYLFAMMDDETRYWIAQEVADSKYAHDARRLYEAARAVAGKKPSILITDGLKSYHDAYKIFHNHLRPHQALQGRTPGELCGIKVEGENKWLTLIHNASRRHQT